MKLEYKILWIDNDDSIYKNHQKDIEEHLINLGFIPNIVKGKDYQRFTELEAELNDFNLFILDYKLDKVKDANGNDVIINGNTIIKDIREEQSIYTDVIFYSAVPEDMRKKAFEDRLSGVYFTSRDFNDFEDDVIGVIDATIKKVQDVNNLRGLIMAEVAELDRIKERIIISYANKNKCGTLEKYIIEKLIKSYSDNTKKVTKYTDSSINEIIGNLYVDSDKKARTIKKVEDTFSEDEYREKILNTRNQFAHIEEKDNMIGDIEFTEENCIKIRKDIKNYKDLLENIEKAI